MSLFPTDIQDFANQFVAMQLKRHEADYDPYARFTKSAVGQDIRDTELAIAKLAKAPTRDRRAFAALVLFKVR